MLLRKRCRLLLCQLQVVMLMFGLLLVLVIVAILNPEAQREDKPQDFQYYYEGGGHGWAGEDLVQERAEESNHFKVELLSPLSSLREEGLIAIGMSGPERNFDKVPRKMYRIVKQLKRKNEETSPSLVLRSELNTNGFDEEVSKNIPLHRIIPDGRHPECLQQNYGEKLPIASVIICFHNEGWSTLLRTVHSVLDNSPRTFLKEIILVDDLSHQEHLKSALSEYISRIGGVKLIRSNKRLGVIGGRMLGAARATGEVLIFMDSHCECHPGWLEPLLSRIMHNRNRIVSPVIDFIDWKTFEYSHSSLLQQGVFDWKLDFHWVPLPEHEEKVRQSPIIPFRSPVIPGYVLASDRHYFQNIGGFDTGINSWGVETTELSIRVWLCGGSVEIVPCSRVGHAYQNHTMHNSVQNEDVLRSKVRTAELWMDSYKAIFYRNVGNSLLNRIQESDINEHEQLRQRLGCKRFQWFLANVYPEINMSTSTLESSGQLFNAGFGLCMTHTFRERLFVTPVKLSSCDENGNQVFEYNSVNEIRLTSVPLCLTVRHEQISFENCTTSKPAASRLWHFGQAGSITHIPTGKCIEAMGTGARKSLYLNPCSDHRNQIWKMLPAVCKASA
ncbi:hypothetical protein XENTR_v10016188 [Xenopus tropicalis]|uniref:Polypeptide N-acetylgalactosaminyltransferase n=1 Tax=Xenopus tropicalis TaxID=8364 RepID=A0A803J7A7_XENTR|nr:polypeptide N-acetylgalactosaminyltransferase 15 [Xenopus tropicalis]KAE8596663.1 hypothetical protein XENTR_v10016188 [Xenopus tropicalis]